MSVYTTQVRFICETYAGKTESVGFSKVNEVIQSAIPKVFDFEFPIYDEDYRNVLCTKILKHYYTREIGAETVGLWKLWLDTKLNEIMPYYNELYKSTLLEFNPLYTVNFTRNYDRNGTDKRIVKSDNTSNGTNRQLYSDTPQGALNGVDDENYLTSAGKNINNDRTDYNENNDLTSTEKYVEKIMGLSGGISPSKLVAEFRKTLLNIDMMIIEDLSDLFMNLW